MKKECFFTGKTTEIALAKASVELNISEDDISYEIDQMPAKGFLGIGGNAARIKVFIEDSTAESAEQSEIEKVVKTEKPKRVVKEKPTKVEKVVTSESKAKSVKKSDDEIFDINNVDLKDLKSHINSLFIHMKATNASVAAKICDNEIHVNITGKDAGLLIGKHGETLDALSYYVNLYLNRKTNSRVRLILDIEDYRLKRKVALEELATKMANSVLANNRNVTLESMQPYERRIIHTVLEGIKGITTYSVGNDPYRKIVIAIKKN